MSREITVTPPSIQEEIKQSKPFRTRSQEAYLALLRTADDSRRYISKVLEPAGVTLQQYNVLRILRGAEPDGLNTLAIAGRMVERAPGITRMLDRLEKKGWIRRSRGTADRRCVTVRISPSGLALLAGLDDTISAADDHMVNVLTDKELTTMIQQLDRIRAAYRVE